MNTGRNTDGPFPYPPRDVVVSAPTPIHYPATLSDSGFVGLGVGNVVPGMAWCPRMAAPYGHAPAVYSTSGFGSNPFLVVPSGPSAAGRASSEDGDDSLSGRKVKLLCSFGGKILPRPSDGMLRYAGGQTRIVNVKRNASFNELVQKMVEICGKSVAIKYQLPDEDLDALVSVSCPDDLEIMMDEYDKLVERSSDRSAKLRMFLFLASELDSPRITHSRDLQDSGQRYVDAINGIVDGFGGCITRKESISSFPSTQNSDFSGNEAIDSSITGLNDLIGLQIFSVLSPRGNSASGDTVPKLVSTEPNRGNSATFGDTVPKLVSTEPNPATIADIPMIKCSPHASEIEHSVPASLQPQLVQSRALQAGMSRSPPAPYSSHLDSQPGALNHTDISHIPSQMGYPNPMILGTVGSVVAHPQPSDSSVNAIPHQYIAVPCMKTSSSSPYIDMEPNLVHPFSSHQQPPSGNVPKESTVGPNGVPVSGKLAYCLYQTHVTPSMLGGGYVWHQVPSGHVVLSEGWATQQQAMLPENFQQIKDPYMSQKTVPHSDFCPPDMRNKSADKAVDSNSVYQSVSPEEPKRNWTGNNVSVTGALGVGASDKHGPGNLPGSAGFNNIQGGLPMEPVSVSQNPQASCGGELSTIQKAINSDHPAFMSTVPQPCQGITVPPLSVSMARQLKHDAMLNKPVICEVPLTGGMPLQTAEFAAYESLKDHPTKPSEVACKDDIVNSSICNDGCKPITGRMEALHVYEISDDQGKLPIGVLWKDGISVRTNTDLDADLNEAAEMPPNLDASSYLHDFAAVEPFVVGRQPISDSKVRGFDLPDELWNVNPMLSSVDSAHLTEERVPVTQWGDCIWQFQPKMVHSKAENVLSSGTSTLVSPIPPSSRFGDIQDSSEFPFGVQVPWNHCHDIHSLPPMPVKITTKKDAFREPIGDSHLGSSGELNLESRLVHGVPQPHVNLNGDFSSAHVLPTKGSAEDLIGKQLHAVAVDVAASVLQTSSSHPDLPAVSESSKDMEAHGTASEMKDIKTKLLETSNLGSPVSDGIGRLQIIKNDDLEELRELGSGTFGTVYHGKWRGTDVAIKRINDRCFAGKASEQDRMRHDFWNEAIKLADLHHPNVVAFYGLVLDEPSGSVATVTEYMANGSLRNALQKNEKNLDKRKRLLIAMDVAFGMEYLHGKNIVHFDLKSDNLLVNLRDPQRPICKVGDLGLSKVKCQTLISGGVRGTLPWMAPELLNGSSSLVSEKVDVFSFGIVLWELLTGEEPYADLHYGAIIGGIVSNTLRPVVPDWCDLEWRTLMERCWSAEPSERPSFTEIASQLRAMAAMLKGPPHHHHHHQKQ